MFRYRKTGVKSKITGFILVLSLILPSVFLGFPDKTEAQFVPVQDNLHIAHTELNIAQNSITSFENVWQSLKDNILDQLVWILTKTLIRQFTLATVNWINNGFDGSPAFIQDPSGFFLNVADAVAGGFIEEIAPWLCEPFSLNIQFGLELNFGFSPLEERFQCTLTDVINNIQGFTSGNFYEGGWDGWFSMTQNPRNNPYGAYVEATSELAIRIDGAQSISLLELEWGGGFLSFTDEDGNIATPGSLIADQFSHVLGSDLRVAELADELNEAFSAIGFALMGQVLGGGGLSGFSSDSVPGSGDPIGGSADPTINITASETNIQVGDNVTISWESDADECQRMGGSGGWATSGFTNETSGTFPIASLSSTTTFIITCVKQSDAGTGSASDSVTVNVES